MESGDEEANYHRGVAVTALWNCIDRHVVIRVENIQAGFGESGEGR